MNNANHYIAPCYGKGNQPSRIHLETVVKTDMVTQRTDFMSHTVVINKKSFCD